MDVGNEGKGGILIGGSDSNEGSAGALISTDGLANWIKIQVNKRDNPTEFMIYGSSSEGYVRMTRGSNIVSRVSGDYFSKYWEGHPIYIGNDKLTVYRVVNDSELLIQSVAEIKDGGYDSIQPYNFSMTTGESIINCDEHYCHWVSGDPFTPIFYTDFHATINGKEISPSFIDPRTIKISDASHIKGGVYKWQGNINDQLSTLRIQALQGDNEENVNIMAQGGGGHHGRHFSFVTGVAGLGQYRPIFIGTGSNLDGGQAYQLGVYPKLNKDATSTGYVSLGGVDGSEVMRIYANPSVMKARLNISSSPTRSEIIMKADGNQKNVSIILSPKGQSGGIIIYNKNEKVVSVSRGFFQINKSFTPASEHALCTKGELSYDENYLYVCVKENSWRRSHLSDWSQK